jgi:hypothetical protein
LNSKFGSNLIQFPSLNYFQMNLNRVWNWFEFPLNKSFGNGKMSLFNWASLWTKAKVANRPWPSKPSQLGGLWHLMSARSCQFTHWAHSLAADVATARGVAWWPAACRRWKARELLGETISRLRPKRRYMKKSKGRPRRRFSPASYSGRRTKAAAR